MLNVYYQDEGQGFPLVLLHGFCETHEIWTGIAGRLSDTYRILMPDLPGFGQTAPALASFSLEDIAKILQEWLVHIGIDRCIMIGHSLGGYITLAMADSYRELMAGMGLFNSSAYADSPGKKENRDKLIEFIGREGVPPFIKTFIPSLFYHEKSGQFAQVIERLKALGEKTPAEAVTGYAAAMKMRPDRSDLLARNRDNVLLIAGEHDQNVPLEQSKAMASMLNPRHVHILPDTAHMAMYEQPAMSAGAIRDFADRVLRSS